MNPLAGLSLKKDYVFFGFWSEIGAGGPGLPRSRPMKKLFREECPHCAYNYGNRGQEHVTKLTRRILRNGTQMRHGTAMLAYKLSKRYTRELRSRQNLESRFF